MQTRWKLGIFCFEFAQHMRDLRNVLPAMLHLAFEELQDRREAEKERERSKRMSGGKEDIS